MAETNRRKENIRRAAIWASLGFSQEEISHRLGIQQSGVSKMLKEARKARLLSDPAPIYHGPKKEVDDEESLLGLGDLKRLLKDLACLERESNADIWPTDELPTIEPFYSGPDKNKLPEWSEGLMNWASHACGAIQKLILSSCRSGQPNLIGVASGRIEGQPRKYFKAAEPAAYRVV
jgi:transposase